MKSNNYKIVKNTLFLYLRMGIMMFVGLYTSRIVINLLGVTDFGIYNVIAGFVVIFSFINGALSTATSRFITVELGKNNILELNKYFNSSLLLHLVAAVIIVILAESIGPYFIKMELTIPIERIPTALLVFHISTLQLLINFLIVPYTATIIAYEKMDIYAYVGVVTAIVKLLLIMLIEYINYDNLLIYSLILLFCDLLNLIYLYCYCNNYYEGCKLKFVRNILYYKKISTFIGFDLIGNVSNILQTQGLNLLLNIYGNPSLNAARGISYQIEGNLRKFSDNFMTALKPQIIKLYASGNIIESINLVYRGAILSFGLFSILLLPVIFNIDFILDVWLGFVPEFTSIFSKIILLITLEYVIQSPFLYLIIASGRNKMPNIIVGITLIISFFISWFALSIDMPFESVFYILLVFRFVADFMIYFLLQRYIPIIQIKDIVKRIYIPCYSTFIMVYVLLNFFSNLILNNWGRLFFDLILSTMILSLGLFVLAFDKVERNNIIGTIKNYFIK